MSFKNYLQSSLKNRLQLALLTMVLSILLVAMVLLFAFVQVRIKLGQVVGTQFEQTVENSRASRDIAQFLARQKLLATTFYGHDSYLQIEGDELQRMLAYLSSSLKNPALKKSLSGLETDFAAYLGHCQDVNELILWRSWQDQDINSTLLLLEEIIAERMIEEALQGDDVSYFEQLNLLVSGFRETLLEIAKLNAEENQQRLLGGSHAAPPPLTAELQGLELRLRTLTASEPPIDRFGRHLIDQVKYYRHLMKRYQQEMIHLGEAGTLLNAQTETILNEMADLDLQSSVAAQQIGDQVEQTISTAAVIVLGMLGVLTLLLWWSQQNLFRKHIRQPMAKIQQRLIDFHQGDSRSPLPLERQDEWGEIESAFNKMLGVLQQSWADLKESERRYRDIFNNASEGIFQSSIEGKFLNINPAMANILGYDSTAEALAEVTDLASQLYLQPGFRDQMLAKLREVGSVQSVEVRMRRRSGEIFWASVNGHLIKDAQGNERHLEGTLEDITIRRNAEQSLRQLQRYLQNIIDSMPSILIGVDIDCRVTLWNSQAERICGVPAQNAKGQLLTQVFSLLSEEVYLPGVLETLRRREPLRLQKVPSETGEVSRFFDLLIYPLTTTEASGVVIYIDEVTERVKIEDVMVQSEKMLSVGGLAAGMAHEINNPLAAILQNAQVLAQRLSPALAKNQRTAEELGLSIEQVEQYAQQRGLDQMLQSITDSGQRAAKIVENMLSFSRKSTSNFIPRALADLVEQALVLAASDYDLKHKYDFRRIRIVREFSPLPDVPCEASQIQQVVFNLLKNAAHALGEGVADPQIVLRTFLREQSVCLQVEDNGPGIDAETSKRIFEPFYTTKEVGAGTGLGLSVAYFIVTENHKGKLTIDSGPGKGSCFSVCLPLSK